MQGAISGHPRDATLERFNDRAMGADADDGQRALRKGGPADYVGTQCVRRCAPLPGPWPSVTEAPGAALHRTRVNSARACARVSILPSAHLVDQANTGCGSLAAGRASASCFFRWRFCCSQWAGRNTARARARNGSVPACTHICFF